MQFSSSPATRDRGGGGGAGEDPPRYRVPRASGPRIRAAKIFRRKFKSYRFARGEKKGKKKQCYACASELTERGPRYIPLGGPKSITDRIRERTMCIFFSASALYARHADIRESLYERTLQISTVFIVEFIRDTRRPDTRCGDAFSIGGEGVRIEIQCGGYNARRVNYPSRIFSNARARARMR